MKKYGSAEEERAYNNLLDRVDRLDLSSDTLDFPLGGVRFPFPPCGEEGMTVSERLTFEGALVGLGGTPGMERLVDMLLDMP